MPIVERRFDATWTGETPVLHAVARSDLQSRQLRKPGEKSPGLFVDSKIFV